MWPDRRLIDLFGIEHPIVLAPMAGAMDVELAIAVAQAGGFGSLPSALLDAEKLRAQVAQFQAAAPGKPLNLNFFVHRPAAPKPYYAELDIDPAAPVPASNRAPFNDALCEVVEEIRPRVVSFHFGLPTPALAKRVQAAGCLILGSATTVAEARWLADHGCDVVIAQGFEAGGHRGHFLSDNLAAQPGTFALVPQVVDAV